MKFAPTDDLTFVLDGFTSTMGAINYNRTGIDPISHR